MIEEARKEQQEEEEKKNATDSAEDQDPATTKTLSKEEEDEDEEDYSTLEEVTKELSDLNSRPAWFDPHVFEKDDFNPDVYIDEMSPFVTPEDLAVEVEKYADDLQNKLVEMVNRDYKDFVALTTDLVDVDAYVKDIKEPLEVLKGEVEEARDVVKKELEKLQNALDRRDELARERESLELIMEATTVCSKVERLLEEFGTSGDGDDGKRKKSSNLNNSKAEFVGGDGGGGGGGREERFEDDGDEIVLVATNVDIDMDVDGEGLEFLRPSKTFLASAERAERNASSSDNNTLADENSALSPRKGGSSSDATTSSSNNDRSDGHNSAEERARILSRVAGEVNRLKFFLSQGKDSQQIRALSDRVKSCDETLLKELNGAFAAALLGASEESKKGGIPGTKLKSAASVKFLLEAYQAVGRASDAEKTVRNALVKPLVSEVTDSAPAPAGIGAREDVSEILKNCSGKAVDAVSFLLDIAKDVSSSESSCDFLGGSVLAEIDAQLHEKRPSSFSPGVPEAFISNYAASMAFIDALQAKAKTISQVAADKFFDSDALRTFHKRWNLSVYFTLRFQEIAGDVDATLTRPGLERVGKGDATTPTAKSPKKDGPPQSPKSPKKQQEINDVPGVFSLAASDAAFRNAMRCFADDVYVPAQADKFVRLAAQIVSRYRAWVSVGTEYLEETALINAAAEKSENTSDDAGGSSSAATAARRTTSSNTWGATAGCEELATVRSEVELFSKKVKEDLVKVAAKKVGGGIKDPEDRNAATNATSQCLELGAVTLDEFLPKITSAIALIVTERCTEALKQLKGITATFRMTNKPTPSKHSHFVPMLLQPLSKFCEESQRTRRLSPIAAKELTREVCEGVTKKYAEMASDLVATVLKTEASLNRLKDRQGKGTAASADATKTGGKLSDTDKILKQLHLDVAEYASRLISVNVQPSSLEAFPALWKALAPEDEPLPA